MPEKRDKKKIIVEIFEDPESRRNIVGLYDLLFKVAKRNPQLWAEIQEQNQEND